MEKALYKVCGIIVGGVKPNIVSVFGKRMKQGGYAPANAKLIEPVPREMRRFFKKTLVGAENDLVKIYRGALDVL